MSWLFYALKRSYVFVEKVLELLFCKERIDHLEDHGAFFLVQFLRLFVPRYR